MYVDMTVMQKRAEDPRHEINGDPNPDTVKGVIELADMVVDLAYYCKWLGDRLTRIDAVTGHADRD